MNKSRLLEIFKSLDKTEVKQLRKWVRSPFFNQREDVVLLFNYLDKNRPLEKPERLDRKYIFSKIFPKEKYDEKKIGYAQSFLYTEIKNYLAYQEFTKDEVHPQLLTTRSLRKRGLNRHFESEWKTANDLLQKQPLRNSRYHFYNYKLQNEQYEYSNSQSRKQPKGLQESSNEFTNYFISEKLEQSCHALSFQMLISADYQQDFLEKVIQHVEGNEVSKETPSINIYFQIHKMLTEKDGMEYYRKLRELLNLHFENFPKEELKALYIFAINYCIKQSNAGISELRKEILELYQEGIEYNIFINNGIFDRFNFKNIVVVAASLKEYDWAENFIHQYKNQLDSTFKKGTFTYSLALLNFVKPDYGKVMELLQQAEFKDIFLHLNAKKMLLRIYFEIKEINALESLLDSFSRYLTRRKDLGYHKETSLTLIKFVRKILQIKPYDKKSKELLRKEISNAEIGTEKKWLLDQLN